MSLAKHVATWSKDPSTRVGAIITDNNIIVSSGYNGFPQKMSDDPELYNNREEKYSRVVHGEINAILFANRPVKDCTLYTWPFAPCDRCCVICIQAGIKHFVFPEPTEDLLSRWGTALEKSKSFMREAGCTYTELIASEIE